MKRFRPQLFTSYLIFLLCYGHSPGYAQCQDARPDPYFDQLPKSPVIAALTFDHSTHRQEAPGSDNWPITWAPDGHQYAIWGDGGGFGGTNTRGRVSFGVARIEGDGNGYTGVNLHGGHQGLHPAQKIGYSWGLISVNGVFYTWAGDSRSELFYSENLGQAWHSAGWKFGDHDGPFSIATALNFGQDYHGARDDYVYVYAPSAYVGWPSMTDGVDLARVHRSKIKDRDAYQFFAGTQDGKPNGQPVWVKNIEQRKPVLDAEKQIPWTINVDYLRAFARYLLSFTSNDFKQTSNLVVLDAPTPWGPWSVVINSPDLCRYGYTFAFRFPAKWQKDDKNTFTMIFSGSKKSDSWNTIEGRVIPATPK